MPLKEEKWRRRQQEGTTATLTRRRWPSSEPSSWRRSSRRATSGASRPTWPWVWRGQRRSRCTPPSPPWTQYQNRPWFVLLFKFVMLNTKSQMFCFSLLCALCISMWYGKIPGSSFQKISPQTLCELNCVFLTAWSSYGGRIFCCSWNKKTVSSRSLSLDWLDHIWYPEPIIINAKRVEWSEGATPEKFLDLMKDNYLNYWVK